MTKVRIKTAYLSEVHAWKSRGLSLKDFRSYKNERCRIEFLKPRLLLSEEMHYKMSAKEAKRKGWKSCIKDKRL